MDTFVEQIIKKQKGAKELTIIIVSAILSLLLIVFILPVLYIFIRALSAILLFAAGYGIWRLITNQNIEFEYSVTNGDIDIDQIIAQRKRKRLVSVTGAKIESLEPYTPEAFAPRPFDRRVMAAPSPNSPDLWCFTYHSKKSGHTLVVFQPEQRVLDALMAGLPALVLHETKKKFAKED